MMCIAVTGGKGIHLYSSYVVCLCFTALHSAIVIMIILISARSPVPPVVREEPEKIKLWREQQRLRLEEKGKQQLGCQSTRIMEFWF